MWKTLRDQLSSARNKAAEDQAKLVKDQAKELAEMKKKLAEIEKKLVPSGGGGGGAAAPAIVNNNGMVVNQQITAHITINAFGKESLAHLGEYTRQVLSSGSSTGEVIGQLGTKIWADPEHPENGTMFTPNVKERRVRTRRADGAWETRDRDVVHRQAHTVLTNHAFNNQPRTEKGAALASPILKEMDAIDKGQLPFPTGVYNALAEEARIHAK